MKVLLITSQLAKEIVEHYAKESQVDSEVLALNVAVAAFLTPETISQSLKKIKLKNFDVILTPGLITGNTSVISEAVGIPAFKGPRYAADLPTILDSLEEFKLSTVIPACELLREKLQKKALDEIENVERCRGELLKQSGNILIGNLAVGKDFPMRILAEIVDAPSLDDETILRLSKSFLKDGAEIIDVGMAAGKSQPSEAKRLVELLKREVHVPVSIDSLDPEEIQAAVIAGADLVLSGDAANIEKIASFTSEVALVLIPTNQKDGYFPKREQERVKFLEETILKARQLGIKKCIADLILDPMDVLGSFNAFSQFANRNPDVPLFVGSSNVTELIDADSVGVNAIIARLSSEIGASILLATEKSDKAKGSISEEAVAAKMMFLAKKRASIPKDLGIDLLLFKDKRKREEPYDRTLEKLMPVITAKRQTAVEQDARGSFRIFLDRLNENIVALHYSAYMPDKPDQNIQGKTADDIYKEIVNLNLASKPEHFAYLGSELAKAEIALRTGKEYIQDKAMFTR